MSSLSKVNFLFLNMNAENYALQRQCTGLLPDLNTRFPIVFGLNSMTIFTHLIVDDKLNDK